MKEEGSYDGKGTHRVLIVTRTQPVLGGESVTTLILRTAKAKTYKEGLSDHVTRADTWRIYGCVRSHDHT